MNLFYHNNYIQFRNARMNIEINYSVSSPPQFLTPYHLDIANSRTTEYINLKTSLFLIG